MASKRLTPHQRSTLEQLQRQHRNGAGTTRPEPDGPRWVRPTGSRGAVAHLEEKGYVLVRTEYGPRGGAHLLVLPYPSMIEALQVELHALSFRVLGGQVAQMGPDVMRRRRADQADAARRLLELVGDSTSDSTVRMATAASEAHVHASERWQQWLANRPTAVARMIG